VIDPFREQRHGLGVEGWNVVGPTARDEVAILDDIFESAKRVNGS
jgi:hypothetical protein